MDNFGVKVVTIAPGHFAGATSVVHTKMVRRRIWGECCQNKMKAVDNGSN